MSAHADLVRRAVRWLRTHHRCNVVFAEMLTASGESPDAIGWRAGLSRVVEVKVSRADFHADRKKAHASHEWAGMGAQRWYLVPEGLVAAHEVPQWCGLAYASSRRIVVAKEAVDRSEYDHRSEALVLTSAVRRFTVGARFDDVGARWERVDARLAREKAPESDEVWS